MRKLLLILALAAALAAGCGAASSPPEQQEKGAGVEEAQSKQEAKPEPKQQEQEAAKPESKPEPKPEPKPSLYEQAAATDAPDYTVDFTASESGQRYDVFVVTEETRDKAKLGAILIELEVRSGSDLVYAVFCEKPGEEACANTVFTDGMLAATDQGKSFMEGSGVEASGEPPVLRIPAY